MIVTSPLCAVCQFSMLTDIHTFRLLTRLYDEACTMIMSIVRSTACLVIALLACVLCFNSAEAGPLLSERIETSKLATVGVLQPGEDLNSPASKTHFTMRGTAVHLRDGFILTARHVVEKDDNGRKVVPNQITVMTAGLEETAASLVGGSAFLDLAVFRITGDVAARLPPTRFADGEASPGQPVYTIGYPLGWGPAMGFGRVGNPNTFIPTAETRLLQLDLSACSGNSGGGVFNEQGELVGLMHAIIQTETAQGEQRCSRFGFAVPGSLARKSRSPITTPDPIRCGLRAVVRHRRLVSVTSPEPPRRKPIAGPEYPPIATAMPSPGMIDV